MYTISYEKLAKWLSKESFLVHKSSELTTS